MSDKLEVLNPATGDVVGVHQVADAADVHAAVARAREASHWWAEQGFSGRRTILEQWKGVLARRIAQLAGVVHDETGKPHADAMLELGLAIDHLGWAASHAERVLGRRRVSSVARSAIPSTRAGRKWRWNAATAISVCRSKNPVISTP